MQFDDLRLELTEGEKNESLSSFSCTFTQSCTCSTCSQGNCTQHTIPL